MIRITIATSLLMLCEKYVEKCCYQADKVAKAYVFCLAQLNLTLQKCQRNSSANCWSQHEKYEKISEIATDHEEQIRSLPKVSTNKLTEVPTATGEEKNATLLRCVNVSGGDECSTTKNNARMQIRSSVLLLFLKHTSLTLKHNSLSGTERESWLPRRCSSKTRIHLLFYGVLASYYYFTKTTFQSCKFL